MNQALQKNEALTKGPSSFQGSLLGWYAVCTSKTLGNDNPYFFSLYNEPLVLYRDRASRVQCVKDFCPHRGASFRGGECTSGELICPYHGARFTSIKHNESRRNTCLHIVDSEYKNYSSHTHLTQYPCLEIGDYIYVYYTGIAKESISSTTIESSIDHLLPETNGFDLSEYAYEEALLDFKCDWSRIVENHLDVLHIFWMHGKSLPGNDVGRHSISKFNQQIEINRNSIKTKYFHKEEHKGEFITQIFIPPGRILMYRGEPGKARYIQILDHLPMANNRSRVIVRHYRKFFRNKLLSSVLLFSPLQRKTFFNIFSEDYLVLQTQTFNLQMGYLVNRKVKLLGEDKTVKLYWDWYTNALEQESPWSIHKLTSDINTIHKNLLMVYPPENLRLVKKNNILIFSKVSSRLIGIFVIALVLSLLLR